MPNLFSKIASQKGTIKLFSGGKQIKSLVPLVDVVRCMKFMEENDKIKKRWVFQHLSCQEKQKAEYLANWKGGVDIWFFYLSKALSF